MEEKENEIFDFDALGEEGRGVFPPGSPLPPGMGRLRRPESLSKLGLQLSIPLSDEELKRLCELASSLGLEVDALVREAILSFIGSPEVLTKPPLPRQVGRPLRASPPRRERTKTIEENIPFDEDDAVPQYSPQREKVREVELPNQEAGEEMATLVRKGTGLLVTTDEREIIISVDYTLWERGWSEAEDTAWWGELTMMSDIPLGEYAIELSEGDGRSGKINISDMKEDLSTGYKTYHYQFKGAGSLINEWEDLR